VQTLLESATGLVERELAMAIRVAEQVRDEVIAKEALHEARERPILSAFRRDAVGIVNLAADAGALTVHNLSKLATRYTEHLRPPVTQTHLRETG
jgi:ABC-type methionine transport system permease subunit